MSQEKVKVALSQDGDDDLLTFDIQENASDKPYIVNLSNSSASQVQLKRIFSRLLTILIEKDIILELEVEEGFTRGLQKEVSKEYIDELNAELEKVKENIQSEFNKIDQASTNDEDSPGDIDFER